MPGCCSAPRAPRISDCSPSVPASKPGDPPTDHLIIDSANAIQILSRSAVRAQYDGSWPRCELAIDHSASAPMKYAHHSHLPGGLWRTPVRSRSTSARSPPSYPRRTTSKNLKATDPKTSQALFPDRPAGAPAAPERFPEIRRSPVGGCLPFSAVHEPLARRVE